MLLGRRRLRVVVVLADEDGRNAPELREVERLVEGADVGGAVAEEGDRDARLAAHLEGKRRPDDAGEPAADDCVRAQVAVLHVVEVHRAAVAVAAALDLPVELGHHLVGMSALGDRVPVRPMRRGDHVAVLERAAHADRHGLLADSDVEEAGQLAGAEALLHLLLETADEEHLPKELLQALGRHCLPLFFEGCHRADKLAVPGRFDESE